MASDTYDAKLVTITADGFLMTFVWEGVFEESESLKGLWTASPDPMPIPIRGQHISCMDTRCAKI